MTKALWPQLVVDVGRLLRRDNIAELKRRPPDRAEESAVDKTVSAVGLGVSTARIPDDTDVHVTVELRPTMRGVEASLRASSRWEGECRRCLDIVTESIEIDTTASFLADLDEDGPVDSSDIDAYPINDERIDLGEVLREELMLALPLSPLCEQSCEGADPDRFPTNQELSDDETDGDGEQVDPRWAGLSALTFDEE